MLTVQKTKELLNDSTISDVEAKKIRDLFDMIAEVLFSRWEAERKSKGVQCPNRPPTKLYDPTTNK